jgi:hypothetical protein
MQSLLNTLSGVLGGTELNRIGRQLGTDEATTKSAVGAALPMLLGALSRNASRDDGAQSLLRALAKDHDGSVLDNPSAVLDQPETGPGEGILRHLFGGRRPAVERGIGQATGLETGSSGKLLAMLAPIVMGALGRQQRQGNLDPQGLARLLGQETRELEKSEPQAMGMVGAVLDADGDGDVDLGDMARHGIAALGKFLNR